MDQQSARPNTSDSAVAPRADDVATVPFVSPSAVSRPRSGSQTGLDGNPDPMNLGLGGRDAMPGGIRTPSLPGNPFGGKPAT
jgi:hypothetical protein